MTSEWRDCRAESHPVPSTLSPAPRPQALLTVLLVEGVVAQAQRGPALPALEAAAVEEASLGAGPLQDVDAPAAEVAGVAALPAGRRLRGEREGCGGTGWWHPPSPGALRVLGRGAWGFAPSLCLAELLAAGTTEGAAGLGSRKPVGSGNSLGGAASPWASACAAPVPALGLASCAGGAAVLPPPPHPVPTRVPSPGQSKDQPARGPWWRLVAGCGHHPEPLHPAPRPPKSRPRWGASAPFVPPRGLHPPKHPSWCTVRTHLGVPVALFGLGVLLGALLPT